LSRFGGFVGGIVKSAIVHALVERGRRLSVSSSRKVAPAFHAAEAYCRTRRHGQAAGVLGAALLARPELEAQVSQAERIGS
jgi:hypothetical protein